MIQALKKYALIVLATVAAALLMRAYVFETYRIPNDYMSPALLAGDYIFVIKIPMAPHRGDIVVFSFPNDPRKDFLKRVVGLPGDRLEIRDGKLVVNGQSVSEPAVLPEDAATPESSLKPLVLRETLGRHSYVAQWQNAESHPDALKMIEVRVPDGQVFVLGDNREKGQDSREWGFLREDFIKGKALFTWFSVGAAKKIRWHRIFKGMD